MRTRINLLCLLALGCGIGMRAPPAQAQSQFLLAVTNPAPAGEPFFGRCVAALGSDRFLVGAYGNDIGAANAGAAYLFNSAGALLTTFTNPTPAADDYFGYALAAVGNDKVLVGALFDDTGAVNAGAAYLFLTNGTLLTTFTNPTPASGDMFGRAVAGVGVDRVLLGAHYDDTGAPNAGAAYLFKTNGVLVTTFTNPAPASDDFFGFALAAVGTDKVLIGAPYKDISANNAGAAYLFLTNGTWLATFTNPAPAPDDYFGYSVAAVGPQRVLIGAPYADPGATNAGAAYLFDLAGHLLVTFTNPAPVSDDLFGWSAVAVGPDRVLIGAYQADPGATNAGAAYLFDVAGHLLATLTNPAPNLNDYFGGSMAALGNARLVIGAYGDDTASANAGAVYLFAYNFPPAITEHAVTQTSSWETEPRLGNDGISDLVVFMRRETNTDGSMGPGTILFQRLDTTGAAMGPPVPVTTSTNDNDLDDVSGDWIAYTAYDSVSTMSGRVMVCQISSGLVFGIGSALAIQEPRICGSKVVWREGGAGVTQVMLYDLSWLGTARDADILAGPIPPTYSVDIGDRFVVWAERTSGQQDIVAYDLTAGVRVAVTSTPGVNESEPSSSGAWIVWQAQDKGVTNSRVLARNLDTAEERVIVDNGVFNYRPSVDGDLIAYEGIANGHLDVSVYRISTGETFQITTNSADQYLADVFGNNVAYVDQRTGNEDIYVSHLQFVPSIPLSTNANLAGLVLSAGTLTPAFDPAVTNYTATVPNHTNSVTVTPTSADANATIQVRVNAGAWSNVLSGTASAPLPLSVGANLIDVKVTAQDLTAKIYTLVVTREPNLPPVADAGPDRNAYTEFAITLQGTAYDPDGEPVIGWYWAVDQSPCGNCWLLFDDTTPTPTFKASINGDYVLLLVVEDPTGISAADFVTVHVRSNLPPVAVATADRTNITVGATVCFDGSQSSDPEAGPLSYTWNFGDGSLSARTNAVCHTFTDVGTYDVGLQVRDERGAYDFDFVSITVLPPAVLRVALTSTNTVLLAWPAALTGYDLQQNADLATTNWLAVTNPSVVVGDEKQVIFDPNPGNRFYRLHKP